MPELNYLDRQFNTDYVYLLINEAVAMNATW